MSARRTSYSLALHGGAGTLSRKEGSGKLEREYREALSEALRRGERALAGGERALSAVEAVVTFLEDCPLFNAGKGAVLNAEGAAELDAAIMDGATLRAGAAAQLRHVRNPIRLARRILECSPHVLLAGSGAERFAAESGLAIVRNGYFRTERRERQLRLARKHMREHGIANQLKKPGKVNPELTFGTVGAVCRDVYGHLAAATSTGGMTNKRWGRIGDSPVIGAGTYAEDGVCAISATGYGEFFIRTVFAHEVAAQIRIGGRTLAQATLLARRRLEALGGEGGYIAVGGDGAVELGFNSNGMYRACVRQGESPSVAIF